MAKKKSQGFIIQMEKGKPKGKCRKWKLRVSLGWDPIKKNYPQKTRMFQDTWSEAQKALREFVDEVESGKIVKRSD